MRRSAGVGPVWWPRPGCRPVWPCTVWPPLSVSVGFPVDATAALVAGGLTERFFRAGSSVRRRLERVTAGIFAALAARLATDIH